MPFLLGLDDERFKKVLNSRKDLDLDHKSSYDLPHAWDGVVACAKARGARIWAVLNHSVGNLLHVFQQITVLPT